jgi:cobalamin biosynthesis protein CobC
MAQAADLSVFRRHGGRIAAAEILFSGAPGPWIDLSTGINPHPYPAPRVSRAVLARLPHPEELADAEAAAAAAFGVEAERVCAVPGTEIALRLLPRLLGARSVALAPGGYGGHAQGWAAAGAELIEAPGPAEARVIVNPANPDGLVTARGEILASAAERWTIVDEAFVDVDPELSVAAQAGGRLVVLRSFGKFYGLPGVRLGFVVADPTLLADLRALLGDWPVAAEALAAAAMAYRDAAWAERTRVRLIRDAARLHRLLVGAGLQVLGGTSLYRLAQTPQAEDIFLRLAGAGILCRPFENTHRLRFGLPATPSAWRRLAAALDGDGT